MRQRSGVRGSVTARGGSAQDVGDLHRQKVRSHQGRVIQHVLSPSAHVPTIDERADDHRGIENDRHRRSASRCSRMRSVERRLPVHRLRSRTRASTTSGSGRSASPTSSARRYSCSERPERRARAASSSRTSSGTSRIVMEGMQSFCMFQLHDASIGQPAVCCRFQHAGDQHLGEHPLQRTDLPTELTGRRCARERRRRLQPGMRHGAARRPPPEVDAGSGAAPVAG